MSTIKVMMLLAAAASSQFGSHLESLGFQNGGLPIKQVTGASVISITAREMKVVGTPKTTPHYTVYLTGLAPTDEVITLSDSAGILDMPATVTVLAGHDHVGFSVFPIASGDTTLTATCPANSASMDVEVDP